MHTRKPMAFGERFATCLLLNIVTALLIWGMLGLVSLDASDPRYPVTSVDLSATSADERIDGSDIGDPGPCGTTVEECQAAYDEVARLGGLAYRHYIEARTEVDHLRTENDRLAAENGAQEVTIATQDRMIERRDRRIEHLRYDTIDLRTRLFNLRSRLAHERQFFAPCLHEDGSGQRRCAWDAQHSGNGTGRSFIKRGGTFTYVSHSRAHRAVYGR